MDSKVKNITISLSVIFAIISYGIIVYFKNGEVIEILSLGIIVTTVTLLWLAVEKYVWKMPYLNKLLHAKPDLSGVWIGTVLSYGDGNPHEAKLEIIQTWTTLNIRAHTKRADSNSVIAIIKPTNEDSAFYDLIFTWEATSKKGEELNGGISFMGTSILQLDLSQNEMRGHYFTNISPNQTMGELNFRKEVK